MRFRGDQIHELLAELEEVAQLARDEALRRNMALVLCRLNRWEESTDKLRNIASP